ncbi:MAG: rod shape-determining protein MreC [Lachnospiraceae bacterium]
MIQGTRRRKGERKRIEIPGRYLLLVVTVLCIALIAITYNTSLVTRVLNTTANYLVVPVQTGISRIGNWLVDREKLQTNIKTLQEENAALKQENEELAAENSDYQQAKSELQELRDLYQLDGTYADFDKTAARVIAKDTGSWYHSFVIDKGTDDGLSVDMNVLAGTGLVGRITSIGPDWAKVETIIDDDSNVSCEEENSKLSMIVSGSLASYADGTIPFARLQDPSGLVQVGDRIVTSNISDKYLAGILVGYVSSIQKDPNNLTKSGMITPAVDFSHLGTVLVITTTKQDVSAQTDNSGSTTP